jgi:opacity protein-like surface antigen
MRFSRFIALIAILGLAAQAQANDGTLRRSTQVAQADDVSTAAPTSSPGVVIVNSTTTAQPVQAQPVQAVQQPATVVEASPVSESKAESLRKARQEEEVHTEQKIVEKLEESRLKEEQERAQRLFGNRFDESAQQQQQAQPAVAPVVAQPAATPAPQPNVTIEKVEIVQPAKDDDAKADKEDAVIATPAPAVQQAPAQPVAESKTDLSVDESSDFKPTYSIGAILAAPNYNANNVKSNYGLGVSIGSQVDERWAVEGRFIYSNYYVDTFWRPGLYNNMDQYDITADAKFYLMTGKLKPYIGASVSYILRKYEDRVKQGTYWAYNNSTTNEDTNAVNAGAMAGVDFELNKSLTIGGGLEYSHNIMNNRNNFVSIYNLNPTDTKALEEIDFTTVSVNAKMTF